MPDSRKGRKEFIKSAFYKHVAFATKFCFLARGVHGNLGKVFNDKFSASTVFDKDNLTNIFSEVLDENADGDVTIDRKYISKYLSTGQPNKKGRTRKRN